jgi:hypothetical protein
LPAGIARRNAIFEELVLYAQQGFVIFHVPLGLLCVVLIVFGMNSSLEGTGLPTIEGDGSFSAFAVIHAISVSAGSECPLSTDATRRPIASRPSL